MMMKELGKRARDAKSRIAAASTNEKNKALEAIAAALLENEAQILEANAKDLEDAEKNGVNEVMQDRLRLTAARIQDIADACIKLTQLDDPVGQVMSGSTRPNGMRILKKRVPMGVVGIIYESRPNVTVDAAALCLKSGNAAILRGGKEAIHSNLCLMKVMQQAIEKAGFDPYTVQLVEDTTRESALAMMKAKDELDLLIPRGGAGLIRTVVENSLVPVIETGTGNCHIYIDKSADLDMAIAITDNGKTQRPSVCNALETCLVHEAVAEKFLPALKNKLDEHKVEIRGCERTKEILGDHVVPATEKDYATEFLDYILAVRVVDTIEQAIQHISTYSTGHSECIVTGEYKSAEMFQKEVDAAAVYVNCSTRFTDGGEFGLGAEIGISTQKLHVRGPMGLTELTTDKYVITGDGQIR